MKVYWEHNSALSREIRRMQNRGCVELVHFPYDPESRSRHIRRIATPSGAQIRDLNLTIEDLPGTLADYSGSGHLEAIRSVLGREHRRDALHVDSAFKSGCAAFVTRDSDILDHKAYLERLLGMKFFHPEEDRDALRLFVSQDCGTA